MTLIIFAIPFITAIILLCTVHKKVTPWEYIVLFAASFLMSSVVMCIMKGVNSEDTEYLEYYVVKATHYEDWNERVKKTRRVECGKDDDGEPIYRTETYYETVYHEDEYHIKLNGGNIDKINKEQFTYVIRKLDTEGMFRNMDRDFYTIDGDAYDYYWSGQTAKIVPVTHEHYYINKIKGSKSIFNLIDVSDEEKKEYGLYDYPPIKGLHQSPVLGYKMNKIDLHYVNTINALLGQEYQFRIYMLFFGDKDPEVAEYQRGYWEGGNKNELVLCFGNSGDSITWCRGFSWCDSPEVEIECRNYFMKNPKITNRMQHFSRVFLPAVVKEKWHRKEFKDFSYLSVDLTIGQQYTALIVTIITNILLACFIVFNDFDLIPTKRSSINPR